MRVEYNGTIYELEAKTKSAKIIKYKVENVYEVVIPHTIKAWGKTFSVVEIANEAFKYSDVRKIKLPNTINRIGEYAFYASKLAYIFYESNDMLLIDDSAFSNCTELKIASFKGIVKFSGKNHFYNCYMLDTFYSHYIVGMIPDGAFSNCTRLYKFHFSQGVEIAKDTFFNTRFKEVFFHDDVIIHGSLEDVVKTDSILCCSGSKFLDLVYEGYSVSVVDKEVLI